VVRADRTASSRLIEIDDRALHLCAALFMPAIKKPDRPAGAGDPALLRASMKPNIALANISVNKFLLVSRRGLSTHCHCAMSDPSIRRPGEHPMTDTGLGDDHERAPCSRHARLKGLACYSDATTWPAYIACTST
jgi:hypothetical protein